MSEIYSLEAFRGLNFLMKISLQIYTRQVIDNTFASVRISDDRKNPMPALPGLHKSPIKHIVYITKENRTYDEIFGQMKEC